MKDLWFLYRYKDKRKGNDQDRYSDLWWIDNSTYLNSIYIVCSS